MSTSVSIRASKVTFPNQLTSMAGNLFVPPNMDKTKKYPALAVAHPFGGVKEQTAGIYASKMAWKGYVTLTFDASHQGESGGYPRDTENPVEKMEDIRCAIDYMTTLPIVDEERVGLLGICAGGSYVLGVAPTEVRAKAIASVSLWDLRLTAQEGWPAPDYDKAAVLVEIGKQRTAQARGLSVRRDDGIPKKVPEGAPGIIKNPIRGDVKRKNLPISPCQGNVVWLASSPISIARRCALAVGHLERDSTTGPVAGYRRFHVSDGGSAPSAREATQARSVGPTTCQP